MLSETVIKEQYNQEVKTVLNEIDTALHSIDAAETERLIEDICNADKVFLIGVGRVMMSLQAFCKRLTHLGIDAHCVGDITEPAMTESDILVVASGSGESIIPVAIAKKAKELNCKMVIHIGSNRLGSMSKYTDYMVRIPVQTRLDLDDEIKSKQIMTSLFEQVLLLYGDVLAMLIMERKNINFDKLWKCHANLE